MPPVLGVLFLILAWGVFELVVWLARRRLARRRPPALLLEATRAPSGDAAARGAVPAPASAARAARQTRETCVVLVHGFGGWGELRLGGRSAAYFRGVKQHLEARGICCVVPRLPAVASIEARARVLAEELAQLAHKDIHVIAHSMGGLDARYALARTGARGVRSLVTVATPHRGTPLATLGARVGFTRVAGLERALLDLTPDRVLELSDVMGDVDGVRYASVVVAPREGAVHPLLVPTHRLLARWVGENDGLVPVDSQAWGEVVAAVDTDHWGAVGWGKGAFDAPTFYASLVDHVTGLATGPAVLLRLPASFPVSPQ